MSKQEIQVQEVFGQFAVEIDGVATLFATNAAALTAASESLNGVAQQVEADLFAASMGFEGKNAVTKANGVKSYLAWVDAGKPVKEVVEVPVEEAETADEAVAPAAEETAEETQEEF